MALFVDVFVEFTAIYTHISLVYTGQGGAFGRPDAVSLTSISTVVS